MATQRAMRLGMQTAPKPARPRRTRVSTAVALGLFCLLAFARPELLWAKADPTRTSDTAPPKLPLFPIRTETLENGLRVVLAEDHTNPTVAVCVTYDVGSRDEARSQAGFAHLFEHMMFQGSRNVPKGGHFATISASGGRANGTTNKERTNFFETVPSNQLARVLWLEADRMKSLALTRKSFRSQKQVVQEEFRANYSNRAYSLGRTRLAELALQPYWAYEHPTIGSLESLEKAPFGALWTFHRQYYRPDNAVVSISGDLNGEETLELVREYFGSIPPGAEPPPSLREVSLRQTSERLSVVEDGNAQSPGVFYGWVVPEFGTREHRALELAAVHLAAGASSRLKQSLIYEKASARSVSAWISRHRGPSLFAIETVIAPLSGVDTNQKWLDGELKRLRLIGPSAEEAQRAKTLLKSRKLRTLQSNVNRAVALGEHALLLGNARRLHSDWEDYLSITAGEIRATASKYLLDERRSIVEVYPPGWVRDLGPVITTETYVVRPGDNLIRIARQYGTTAGAIAKANRISAGKPIFPGQRLFVSYGSRPRPPKKVTKVHVVKKGDSLIRIAKRYGVTVAALTKENRLSRKKPIIIGRKLNITVEVTAGKGKSSKGKTARKKKSKKKKGK